MAWFAGVPLFLKCCAKRADLLSSCVHGAGDRDFVAAAAAVRVLRGKRGVRSEMPERRIGCFDDIFEETLKVRVVCADGD